MLVWLTFSRGVPVGVWLKHMGVDKICSICHQGMLEIVQHRFIRCPCVLLL